MFFEISYFFLFVTGTTVVNWCTGNKKTTVMTMESFVASARFLGARPGYVFKSGVEGTGYYVDNVVVEKKTKRKRSEPEEDERAQGDAEGRRIEAMLREADEVDVEELDATSAKRLLLHLEKKMTLNRRERIEFVGDPKKFVDSEIALDEAVKSLGLLAAAPELYPAVVACGGAKTLASLFEHENSDVIASALASTFDLTDGESSETQEAFDGVKALATSFVENEGLLLLGDVASRLDEKDDEEARALHDLLGIVEHLAELGILMRDTDLKPIVRFLLQRVALLHFDENKLYASEVLSVLLSNNDDDRSSRVAKMIVKETFDKDIKTSEILTGMDMLLKAANVFRKKSPRDHDEEECLANIFDCLAATVDNAPSVATLAFLKGEGIELMLRCAKEGKHSAPCSLKVMDVALASLKPSYDPSTCVAARFIDSGGLKILFPALDGKGPAKAPALDQNSQRFKNSSNKKKTQRAKRTVDEKKSTDERVLGIVASLCFYAAKTDAPQDAHMRLVAKFLEGKRIQKLIVKIRDLNSDLSRETQDLLLEDDDHDEGLSAHARLLRAGGHALRLATTALAFAVVHSPSCRRAFIEETTPHQATFTQQSAHILANFATELLDGLDNNNDDEISNDVSDDVIAARQLARHRAAYLRDWAAAVVAIQE